MTIKKLTVAAAIAVGIATCSLTSAMAACPCDQRPIVTGPACPCEAPVQKCSPCQKPVTQCDPCEKKSPCDCPDLSCDKPAQPACATCPQSGKPAREDMKQVYAYPNAIYGYNNYIGDDSNSIFRDEMLTRGVTASHLSNLNASQYGVTVAGADQLTGAASQLPCLNEAPTRHNGIPIIRNERLMDNNSCPIEINTSNSLEAIKKTFMPFELERTTGAASNLSGMFPDVPNSYWAACDIDKLALNDVVVGYPDRMFKPQRNISRAEFATMLVKGFNMDTCGLEHKHLFTDVPNNNWANPLIAKAVDEGYMKGYPNGTFKPNSPVTRAEALCTISKGINSDIDQCKADEILSQYRDGNTVPNWAQIPVAKALNNGALKDSPNSDLIRPYQDASRADVASMLQTVRVAAGYDTNPTTANDTCPICTDDKKAYIENEEIVKIPTLKLEFLDEVNAKSSHVGQRFAATTLEDITINGQMFPCGSKVMGKVVEVIRPSGCQKGALKLAFTEIQNDGCKVELPKQILTAQINKSNTQNPIARLVQAPFTWAGSLVGIVGRTTGGMISNLGNAVEDVSSGVGIALGETFQGQFGSAGRSLVDATVDTLKAPVDFTRTALSGTMGLLQTTGDEVAYLVDPSGAKISAVNPREHVTIAFGCSE